MYHDWQARINNAPRPFNLVSQNLQGLGALSIDRYLSAADPDLLATDLVQSTSETSATPPISKADAHPPAPPHARQPNAVPSSAVKIQNVARLCRACQRAFGGEEALKFDFVEGNSPNCNVQPLVTTNAGVHFVSSFSETMYINDHAP